MALKSWFGGGGARETERELSLEDLVVLERYEEAEARLKLRLKDEPDDLHSHLKLAEVYTALKRGGDAVDEYVFVAEEYARDGFYDKGLALLAKAQRLQPANEDLRLKIDAFQQVKGLDHKRSQALDGLKQNPSATAGAGLELQRVWPYIARNPFIERMTPEQIRRLFSVVDPRRFEPGDLVAAGGSAGEELYLVGRGEIETRVRTGDDAIELRKLGPGDLFGESVLFERRLWPAEFRVGSEWALLYRLSRAGLEKGMIGESDPRRFLDALRAQGLDRTIADSVRKLSSAGGR